MNKQQIIAPLVVLGIVGLIGIIGSIQIHRRDYLAHEARVVGEEIIATTNSSQIVIIGEGFRSKLPEFSGPGTGVSRLEFGDEPGLGDGRAAIRLYLTNSFGAELGIRLKRADTAGEFHVLGYWTPNGPSQK